MDMLQCYLAFAINAVKGFYDELMRYDANKPKNSNAVSAQRYLKILFYAMLGFYGCACELSLSTIGGWFTGLNAPSLCVATVQTLHSSPTSTQKYF